MLLSEMRLVKPFLPAAEAFTAANLTQIPGSASPASDFSIRSAGRIFATSMPIRQTSSANWPSAENPGFRQAARRRASKPPIAAAAEPPPRGTLAVQSVRGILDFVEPVRKQHDEVPGGQFHLRSLISGPSSSPARPGSCPRCSPAARLFLLPAAGATVWDGRHSCTESPRSRVRHQIKRGRQQRRPGMFQDGVELPIQLRQKLPGFPAAGFNSSTSARIIAVTSAERTPCPATSQINTPTSVSDSAETAKKSPLTVSAGRYRWVNWNALSAGADAGGKPGKSAAAA